MRSGVTTDASIMPLPSCAGKPPATVPPLFQGRSVAQSTSLVNPTNSIPGAALVASLDGLARQGSDSNTAFLEAVKFCKEHGWPDDGTDLSALIQERFPATSAKEIPG